MRVKTSKELGLTIHFTEEEARILKVQMRSRVHDTVYLEEPNKHKTFRQDLNKLLARQGVRE